MKHLKKYNENIENSTIEDIKDILLELEDEGFKVDYSNLKDIKGEDSISIKKDAAKGFKYSDIKEVLLRLKDYLGEKLSHVSIVVPLNDHTYDKFYVILFNDEEFRCMGRTKVYDFKNHKIWKLDIYVTL